MDPAITQAIERGEFESKTAQDLLRWALGRFGTRVALASSFGAEDVALIDMMVKLNPKARHGMIAACAGGGMGGAMVVEKAAN